jgi:hypothetical protein
VHRDRASSSGTRTGQPGDVRVSESPRPPADRSSNTPAAILSSPGLRRQDVGCSRPSSASSQPCGEAGAAPSPPATMTRCRRLPSHNTSDFLRTTQVPGLASDKR